MYLFLPCFYWDAFCTASLGLFSYSSGDKLM